MYWIFSQPRAAPSPLPPEEDGDDDLLAIENDQTIDTTTVVEVLDFVNRVEDIMTSDVSFHQTTTVKIRCCAKQFLQHVIKF
jgi:hypothetical protein